MEEEYTITKKQIDKMNQDVADRDRYIKELYEVISHDRRAYFMFGFAFCFIGTLILALTN